MKKQLLLGLSAVALAMATCRPADAWINSRFSMGINWHWQSGNNCWFWGLFRNGDSCCYDWYGAAYGNSYGAPAYDHGFPWFGGAYQPTAPLAATPYTAPQAYTGGAYGNYYYPASYQPSAAPYYAPNYTEPFTWYYQR